MKKSKKRLLPLFLVPASLLVCFQTSCKTSHDPRTDNRYAIKSGTTIVNAIEKQSGLDKNKWELYFNSNLIPSSEVTWKLSHEIYTDIDYSKNIWIDPINQQLTWDDSFAIGKYYFNVIAYSNNTQIGEVNTIEFNVDSLLKINSQEDYNLIGFANKCGCSHKPYSVLANNIELLPNEYEASLVTINGDSKPIDTNQIWFDKLTKTIHWDANIIPGTYNFQIHISYLDKYVVDSKAITLFIYDSNDIQNNFDVKFVSANLSQLEQEFDFFYSNSFFNSSSYTYNSTMATASMALAMASANDELDPEHGYKYVQSCLVDKMHLTNFLANEGYKKAPTTTSIGVSAASQTIKAYNGDYTLIVAPIRSAGYAKEWASNVTVGDKQDKTLGYHKGFYDSAIKVIDFLKEYITTYNINGKVKLWLSGFSRGGAVSNLTSGILTKAIVDHKIQDYLGNDIDLSCDNVYTYTFEAPQGVNHLDSYKNDPKNKIYNNIFNIINPLDLVPKVAPATWGFTRYGIDMYVNAPFINDNYITARNRMLKYYVKNPEPGYETYFLDDWNYYWFNKPIKDEFNNFNMMETGIEFVNTLSETMNSIESYVIRYQDNFVEIMDKAMGEGITTKEKYKYIFKMLGPIIEGLFDLKMQTIFSTILNHIDWIIQSHLPPLSLSWLKSADPKYQSYEEQNYFATEYAYYHIQTRAINLLNCYQVSPKNEDNLICNIDGGYISSNVNRYNNANLSVGIYTAKIGYPDYGEVYLPLGKYDFKYSAKVKIFYSENNSWIKVYKVDSRQFAPTLMIEKKIAIDPFTSSNWYTDLHIY